MFRERCYNAGMLYGLFRLALFFVERVLALLRCFGLEKIVMKNFLFSLPEERDLKVSCSLGLSWSSCLW